ncbi:MAG: pitrilysin family protein [Thermoanaerobaculia bacterium]
MSVSGTTTGLHRHRLDNGLRIVAQRDESLPLVAVNLWYHVGSKNERPGRTGLAHLFEHMLFQGSLHVGTNDHFGYLQQVGGVANGSTWYDRTNYHETVPSSYLELALWLESDRLGFLLPALTSEKLETQRTVVMNERRQRVDNQPYGRALEELHRILYPVGHPYSWPVIGTMEDIAAATLDDVRTFFATYYSPNNAVLSLVGDIDPEEAFTLTARYFEEIPVGRGLPPPPERSDEAGEGGRLILPDEVELSRVYMGWRVPAYGDEDWYSLDVLASAHSDGKTGPLYRDLVYERELAQDVSAMILPTELEALFLLVSTARPETEPERLEEALLDHLRSAAAATLPPVLFRSTRERMATAFLEGQESLDQRADLLSQHATYFDRPEGALEELDRYLGVQPDAVRAAAATHLTASPATVVVVPRERAA